MGEVASKNPNCNPHHCLQAPGRFEYEDVYPPVVEGCEYTPLSYEHEKTVVFERSQERYAKITVSATSHILRRNCEFDQWDEFLDLAMRGANKVTFLSPDGNWISGLYSIDPRITTLTLSAMTGSAMDFQLEILLADIVSISAATTALDSEPLLQGLGKDDFIRAIVINLVASEADRVSNGDTDKLIVLEEDARRKERFVNCMSTIVEKAKKVRSVQDGQRV